jgi:hypothetical protein
LDDRPENRDPHGAAADFLEHRRRRKHRRRRPRSMVVDVQPAGPRQRVPLVIPDHKCALCGAEPISGMTFPGDSIVYFCEDHIKVGRRISERAWEAHRRNKLVEEYIEAKRQQLDGALEREIGRRRCPFCDNELSQEYGEDGRLVEFCQTCDTEFYDAGQGAEGEGESSGFGIIGEAEGFDGPGPADDY